ncbi:MAG: acetylornithine deacetylase [Acidobacteria bacterium]|nr:MAG: acetylornithine deacetylase [Acidobacteriota bacterium]
MTVKETLAELVAIDSVSSRSNSPLVEYLESRCKRAGLSIKRFSYNDEAGIEKINLVATSAADEVELALIGHTDTVPYDPNWTEATTLIESDGKLFGRGSCDTKAFIAAALTAVDQVDISTLKKPLALVFTSDEEIGLLGAKYLAQIKALTARYSIVGEPTSLQPIRAGKGYSLAEVVLRGREAHSAYPALGVSAVFRAARLIARLELLGDKLKIDNHEGFNPPYTTFNVGLIKGGTAKNVIAGECRFTLEWRPVPNQKPTRFLELLNQAIEKEKESDPDFECEVNSGRNDSGFETSPESRLVRLLEEATGKTAGSVAFGTEAAQMTSLGSEAVVLGPGDIREAHRTGEFVPIDELNRCVQILSLAINKLCVT